MDVCTDTPLVRTPGDLLALSEIRINSKVATEY